MKWFGTGKNTCPICRNVSKNIYNAYILKMYTDQILVVQRKLDKLEKVKYNIESEYWQETLEDLEREYFDMCDYFETYDE